MEFEDAAALAPSASGMAGDMMHQAQADLADNMDSMTGSGCGPTPTQYEPFTQVSKHWADHLPSQPALFSVAMSHKPVYTCNTLAYFCATTYTMHIHTTLSANLACSFCCFGIAADTGIAYSAALKSCLVHAKQLCC